MITTVELRNHLQDAFGLKLPSTLVYDHPTIAALATFVVASAGDSGGSDGGISAAEILARQV